MSDFEPTEKRLRNIEARVPGFPYEPILLVRLNHHLQKRLRDRTNAALKPHELADTGYIVLAILYGSLDETSTASELSEACHEKPANLTRVCDDLAARGLIERGTRAGDRRSVMITLRPEGRALIEKVLPEVSMKLSSAFAGFTKAEMAQFAGFLARALGNLDKAG
jgi:MarR family transcriptional repressor of emrRAB